MQSLGFRAYLAGSLDGIVSSVFVFVCSFIGGSCGKGFENELCMIPTYVGDCRIDSVETQVHPKSLNPKLSTLNPIPKCPHANPYIFLRGP